MEHLNNTYKYTAKNDIADKIEVEIGDSKQPDFKPQFKVMRWDNEVNFSMRAEGEGVVATEGEKIKFLTNEYEVHQYDKPEVSEDGGFEFEWVLPSLPKTNILKATIETKGLDFFYQPELTQKEIEAGAKRPENIVGSYAVYHSEKQGDYSKIGGKNYKCGKAFHIYRPKALDAQGKETWCNLKIDTEKKELTVEVPQSFLANAVYPVVVDPTFGYTTKGGSTNYWTPYTTHTQFTTTEAGIAKSMTMYLNDSGNLGPTNVVMGLYNSSKSKVVQTTEDSIASGFNNWKTINLASNYELANATLYWLSWQTSKNIYKFYDAGTSLTNLYFVAYNATMPSTFVNDSTKNEKVSIYVTYDLPFPLINKVSDTDAGFARTGDTDPFVSGQEVTYTVQSELDPDTYYWRVRAKDPAGSNDYGAWSTIRSFTLSTSNNFVIADASSTSSAENITLTQAGGTFAMADCVSSSSAEGIVLVFNGGTFIIADASSTSSAENISLIFNGTFAIANTESASSADNIELVYGGGTFTIADAVSASSTENITLVFQGTFTISDSVSGASAENIALIQASGEFSIADATSGSSADNVELQFVGTFEISTAVSDSSAENIVLTQASGEFSIADAVSSSSAENIVLEEGGSPGGEFEIQDSSSASSADNITIILQGTFEIANADSSSSAENIVLVQAGGSFIIADSVAGSSADNITLIFNGTFTIADCVSSSSIENIALALNSGTFLIADSISTSSAENITITFQGTFTIASADSLSFIENIKLFQASGVFEIADAVSDSSTENITLTESGGTFIIQDAVSVSTIDNISIFKDLPTELKTIIIVPDGIVAFWLKDNIYLRAPP